VRRRRTPGTIYKKRAGSSVIPQQDIESIMQQQHMGATGAVNPDTARRWARSSPERHRDGAVTAYSEAEEGQDMLCTNRKSRSRA